MEAGNNLEEIQKAIQTAKKKFSIININQNSYKN